MNLEHLCDWQDGKCRAMRLGNSLCCGICKHLSSTGCTTNNIFCNSWWCKTALNVATDDEKKYIESNKIKILKESGLLYPRYFKSEEELNKLIKK